MNTADRMFEAEWRYYRAFVEVALELHGDREWNEVAPLLEAAWRQGDCTADWEGASLTLRAQWNACRAHAQANPPATAMQS